MKGKFLYIGIMALGLVQCQPKKEKQPDLAPAASQETIPLGDTSRNSLDWDGSYRGFLPCADCEGILTELTLSPDGTYALQRVYWGKDQQVFSEKGTFTWDETGSFITLGSPGGDLYFSVGENRLTQLDRAGNRIESEFADRHVLRKAGTRSDLRGTYWKLVELGGRRLETPAGGKEAHFLLLPGSDRINGNGGCNNFMGSYEESEGSRIRFSQMATTMMACAEVDYEPEYLGVFDTADNYALNRDTLSLNRARMAPLARFVAAMPKGN